MMGLIILVVGGLVFWALCGIEEELIHIRKMMLDERKPRFKTQGQMRAERNE